MVGATIGELMACIFRVPTENVKQKMQVRLVVIRAYQNMLIHAIIICDFIIWADTCCTCLMFNNYFILGWPACDPQGHMSVSGG